MADRRRDSDELTSNRDNMAVDIEVELMMVAAVDVTGVIAASAVPASSPQMSQYDERPSGETISKWRHDYIVSTLTVDQSTFCKALTETTYRQRYTVLLLHEVGNICLSEPLRVSGS